MRLILFIGSLLAAVAVNAQVEQNLGRLAKGAGSTWIGYLNPAEEKGLVVSKWEWSNKNKVIRCHTTIMKGEPNEFQSESVYGWDAERKHIFYYDFHDDEVFTGVGTATANGDQFDFEVAVGKAAKWRSQDEWKDDDTFVFTLFQPKGAEFDKVFSIEFKRQK